MSKVQTQPCVRFKDNVHASLSTFISQAYVLVHVWLHSTHATAPTVMALPTSLKILHTQGNIAPEISVKFSQTDLQQF